MLAYVLPASRASLAPLPDWLEPAATWVLPRVVRLVTPVADPYLSITATRQHWTLFAPEPADWVNSVRVVPYFSRGDGDRDGAAWWADTLLLRGPREVPYPHLVDHRSYRILFNMGYEEWGTWYRPVFARELCRTLRDAREQGPEGVSLMATWRPIRLPWIEEEPPEHFQWMGGYDCGPDERGGAGRRPWPAYGLPSPVPTSGWPVVHEIDSAGVNRSPAEAPARSLVPR